MGDIDCIAMSVLFCMWAEKEGDEEKQSYSSPDKDSNEESTTVTKDEIEDSYKLGQEELSELVEDDESSCPSNNKVDDMNIKGSVLL